MPSRTDSTLALNFPNEWNDQDADLWSHKHLVSKLDACKGRMLRVSAPVPAGTRLLVDTPYAIVPTVEPSNKDALMCSNLVCSRLVAQDGAESRCPQDCCQDVVWCNDWCREADQARHDYECSWLKRNAERMRREELEYDFVTVWHVVRLLAGRHLERKMSSPQKKNRRGELFVRGWEAVNACCAYLDSWPEAQVNHWKRLAETYLHVAELTDLPSPDEVLELICREETNTFGLYPKLTGPLDMIDQPVPRGNSYGLSLFPRAAMFNHSCAPNVTHKPNTRGRMVYTAARDIAAGEELCISYFDLTQHTLVQERQELVRDQFQFTCDCKRCVEEEAEGNLEGMDSLPFGLL